MQLGEFGFCCLQGFGKSPVFLFTSPGAAQPADPILQLCYLSWAHPRLICPGPALARGCRHPAGRRCRAASALGRSCWAGVSDVLGTDGLRGPGTMHSHASPPLPTTQIPPPAEFLARFCTKPSSCMPPCTCQQGAWPLTLRSQLETKSSKLPLSRNC